MIGNPILTGFEELLRWLEPVRRNLHTGFLRSDKLPPFVQDCPPALRILDLLGPMVWDQFPERDLQRFWGQISILPAACRAACLIKLEENLVSMGAVRRYLVEHPAFLWLLGFPLVPALDDPRQKGCAGQYDCSWCSVSVGRVRLGRKNANLR